MRLNCGILAGAVLVGTLGTTPAAAQTGSRLGLSMTAISAVVKGSAVAYDPKNSIYLVVSAYGDLNGRFVSAGGDLIGVPFTIQSGAAGFTHFPGVAYSPDANGGAGGFLVAWHQSVTNGALVHARMVGSNGVLGPESQISADGSWWEAAVDIAYSTASREFLVTWQAAGIRAERIGNNGELLGGNIFVTGTDYHRDPSVAYNPTTNEFMVVYAGYDTSGYVGARRIAAGSGALLGAETLLTRAANTYITEVVYNPATNRFLAAWNQVGAYGRLLDSAGNIVSNVLLLATRFAAYDALGIDYSTTSNTFMMVSHDSQGLQDGATELSGAGAIPDVGFIATDAPTTRGNYYPKIAARSGGAQWLLSTATGFAATTVQRLQSTSSGGGGTIALPPPPPPPPPPAPCTPVPSVTSVSLLNNNQTFPINVTAPSTCAWSASSPTPWLQISSGANSTGNASVGVTALHNPSLSARTGTLIVGGYTIAVSQGGFNAAAVHDVNGDGTSDLVWQYQPTGELSFWALRGNSIIAQQGFNSPGVSDTTWKIAGTGDLDGDGYADFIWQKTDGHLAAWYVRGNAILGYYMLSIPYVGPDWKIRGVGDVNGDGKADLIWQNQANGSLAVWMMNGYTVLSTLMLSVQTMPDPNWIIAGAGDINGDGRADIIWQNQANGGLGAWLLSGNVVIGQQNLSVSVMTDLNWKIRGVGDVNSDGRADLIWQNGATGGLGVWYLNGFTVLYGESLNTNAGAAFVADSNWKIVGPG
jgi:hypothetical protein